MPYISSIERMGEARGEARGKVELINLLLAQQVGEISAQTADDINRLSIDRLNRLALELRNFTSTDDLVYWLAQQN